MGADLSVPFTYLITEQETNTSLEERYDDEFYLLENGLVPFFESDIEGDFTYEGFIQI